MRQSNKEWRIHFYYNHFLLPAPLSFLLWPFRFRWPWLGRWNANEIKQRNKLGDEKEVSRLYITDKSGPCPTPPFICLPNESELMASHRKDFSRWIKDGYRNCRSFVSPVATMRPAPAVWLVELNKFHKLESDRRTKASLELSAGPRNWFDSDFGFTLWLKMTTETTSPKKKKGAPAEWWAHAVSTSSVFFNFWNEKKIEIEKNT